MLLRGSLDFPCSKFDYCTSNVQRCSNPRSLRFDILFLHAKETHLKDPVCRRFLVGTALGNVPNIVHVKWSACLITHRISMSTNRTEIFNALLLLSASLLERALSVLPTADGLLVKKFILEDPGIMKSILTSSSLSDDLLEGTFLY